MFSTSSYKASRVRCLVPLKCRCSKKCAVPLDDSDSFLLPHLIKIDTLNNLLPHLAILDYMCSVATVMPLLVLEISKVAI